MKIQIVGSHFLANALRRIKPEFEKRMAQELTTMAKKATAPKTDAPKSLTKKEVRQQIRDKKKAEKRTARFDKKIGRLQKKIESLIAKRTKLERKRDLGNKKGR